MNSHNGLLPYQEPDLELGRKPFDDSTIILYVKKRDKNKVNKSTFIDIDELMDNFLNTHGKKDFKPFRRQYKKQSKEKAEAALLKVQHDRKVNEIVQFLNDHYVSTNYIYSEVKRIAANRKVVDDLRRMVAYLEKPYKTKMKNSVLEFYYAERRKEVPPDLGYTNFNTNNLVINILDDPYNEGVIN